MQELITKVAEKAGISAEQATKAVDAIKDFVKEKFPMMAGAVDNLLGAETTTTTTTTTSTTTVAQESSIMDKISDVIPGEAGQKVEDFAKNAAHKAEDVFDDVKDKLSGLFGGGEK
jgi:uncharacterized protein YjbJ (UPF0337 family)